MSTPKLAFIGAGNMAEAIVHGVLRAKLHALAEVVAADPSPERRALFSREIGVQVFEHAAEAGANCPVIILAVKPQMMGAALDQLRGKLRPDALIISIAAGISAAFIEKQLVTDNAANPRVVRVMPNTPMLVGAGMSGLAKGSYATDADLDTAERIFAAGGKTVRVPESLIDAVTALSGSGPAYVFYLVEALVAGGIKLGLNETDALVLAKQTIFGAAQLLHQSSDPPTELRRKVTSPGGTTQAAITAFEAGGFFSLVAGALNAAEKRGKELSQ